MGGSVDYWVTEESDLLSVLEPHHRSTQKNVLTWSILIGLARSLDLGPYEPLGGQVKPRAMRPMSSTQACAYASERGRERERERELKTERGTHRHTYLYMNTHELLHV